MKYSLKHYIVGSMIATFVLIGCKEETQELAQQPQEPVAAPVQEPTVAQPETKWIQIEQLARPAINEGTLISNHLLNRYNSVGPTVIRAFLDGNLPEPTNSAVAEVVNEVVAVLNAADGLDGNDDTDPIRDIAPALLPDVMRIDTRDAVPLGTTAYNSCASPVLCGGRKIEDDVMDITLSLLISGDASGAAITDNVSYAGAPGNPAQGHKLLNGQTAAGGAATFPFLATPN